MFSETAQSLCVCVCLCVLGGVGVVCERLLPHSVVVTAKWVVVVVVDRFYIALFSAHEQTHCARMCFYMSE